MLVAKATAQESPQVKFVRKLYAHKLISNDSISGISAVIKEICLKTKYKENISINNGYSAQRLNFYIIDSRKDTSLRDLCAFAGAQTIFLDKYFLSTYLDRLKLLKGKSNIQKQTAYTDFQYWVIGHETAHADLGHTTGHFINNDKPKTQEIARHFHFLELEADKRSITYLPKQVRLSLPAQLISLFNITYRRTYGNPHTTNRFLRCDNTDPYLTIAYHLDGSHPLMTIRTAVLLYLIKPSAEITREAYGFLVQSQMDYVNGLGRKEFH
jgi:hypothetical protein